MFIEGNRLVIGSICDAIWLFIYGEKLAKLTFKEIEAVSVEG